MTLQILDPDPTPHIYIEPESADNEQKIVGPAGLDPDPKHCFLKEKQRRKIFFPDFFECSKNAIKSPLKLFLIN